jgi:hypothetical protein
LVIVLCLAGALQPVEVPVEYTATYGRQERQLNPPGCIEYTWRRTMSIETEQWTELKRLAGSTFSTSLHFAVATVNSDGTPHVTPIGSLMLGTPGEGYFFEVFADRLCANLDRGSQVSVLGVVSSSPLWLRALFSGRFSSPPAFRLIGVGGAKRASTEEERKRWQRKVRFFRLLRGYELLWGNLDTVRELHFCAVEPVLLGPMTKSYGPHLDQRG